MLRRAPVTAVVVDNAAVDVPECPGHRAGYNGLAVLKHEQRGDNFFVPAVAGLNLEHVHGGGEVADLFEPRNAPMELRVVDEHTAELYQPPTPHTKLESCGRYHLLEDGTVEYTFECVPRAKNPAAFPHGYLALFWASYVERPDSTAIHFRGRRRDAPADAAAHWVESVSPGHGTKSTHPPAGPMFPPPPHPAPFPIVLAFGLSEYVHTDAWYYGVSGGTALALMFRPQDRVWFAQSPSGGGPGNAAWDFQWFVPDFEVGRPYRLVMRAACLPFESREQVERATRAHRQALAGE